MSAQSLVTRGHGFGSVALVTRGWVVEDSAVEPLRPVGDIRQIRVAPSSRHVHVPRMLRVVLATASVRRILAAQRERAIEVTETVRQVDVEQRERIVRVVERVRKIRVVDDE